MNCFCGQEIGSTNSYGWQTCTYNEKGEIIYAVCMHGIVCINTDPEIENTIAILEDLKISVQNEVCGFEPCGREQLRIEALDKAINTLKKEIK